MESWRSCGLHASAGVTVIWDPSDERVSCGFHLCNALWWGEFPRRWVKQQPHVVKTASTFLQLAVAHPYFCFCFFKVKWGFWRTHTDPHKVVYVLCFRAGMCESCLDALQSCWAATVYWFHHVLKILQFPWWWWSVACFCYRLQHRQCEKQRVESTKQWNLNI